MIEQDIKTLCETIIPTFVGSIPDGFFDPCFVYQVFAREEIQNFQGFSHCSISHFRISSHGSYNEAKTNIQLLKNALQSSSLVWNHENEWDIFNPPPDGSSNTFNCVSMDIKTFSDEITE
jgi:hypothetical protein